MTFLCVNLASRAQPALDSILAHVAKPVVPMANDLVDVVNSEHALWQDAP
jgi:hypothetical protein